MGKKYTKIVWKIEELWEKYYKPSVIPDLIWNLDFLENYDSNKISKYYSEFKLVDNFDFGLSKRAVFSDGYGNYRGLQNSQLQIIDNKPVYLFDNHNKILYPFLEIQKSFKNILDVVHIDAHPDDAEFQDKKINDLNFENVADYIHQTRISDFFDAISKTKTIGKIYRITHSDSFEFFVPPEKSYVLSLDIDIFGPEGDFVELRDKVRAIALAWASADAVCIAMRPGFIDQEYAKEFINIFTK